MRSPAIVAFFFVLASSTLALPSGDREVEARHDDHDHSSTNHTTFHYSRAVSIPAACKAKGGRREMANLSIAKRIAQNLPEEAERWQKACLASGGDIFKGSPCVDLAGGRGITARLAAADPCEQQRVADLRIDFAKSKGVKNKAELIKLAVAYREAPRNALALDGGLIPSTPFCQEAPRNAELKGKFNKQLNGVDQFRFGGPKFNVVPFGDPASCPFGQKPNVKTCACVKK